MKAHEGRDLSPEFIDSVGRGRVWTGEQALEHGLVDELGGIWTAVERAKEIAGIAPEKNVSLVLLPEPKELLELLLEGDLVMKRPSVEIHPGMEEMISALQWMNRMGSGEILAMMPYRIEFE
jgi:protease-4